MLGGRRRDLVSNGGRNGSRTGSDVLTGGGLRGLIRFGRFPLVTTSPVRSLGIDDGLVALLGVDGVAFDDVTLLEHEFTIGEIAATVEMA